MYTFSIYFGAKGNICLNLFQHIKNEQAEQKIYINTKIKVTENFKMCIYSY